MTPTETSDVVVTGVGLISAFGDTPTALAAGVVSGRGAVPGLNPIADFDVKRYIERKGLASLSRVSQLACAAAAICGSGLRGIPIGEVGVVLGTAWAAIDSIVDFERRAHLDGSRFVDPLLFTETVANVPGGHVSIFNGWSALNVTVSCGTTSGLEALRVAADLLDDGRATAILAGGADALPVHAAPLVMPEAAGGALSEGACWLVLEPCVSASARGAKSLARLAGVLTRQVEPVEASAALVDLAEALLERAGLESVDVAFVHDAPGQETARRIAVRLIEPTRGRVWSPATALGESWAAAGSFAVALALEALAGRPPGDESRRDSSALVLVAAPTGKVAAALLVAPELA